MWPRYPTPVVTLIAMGRVALINASSIFGCWLVRAGRLIGDWSCAMGVACIGNVLGAYRTAGGSFLLSWLAHD